MLVLVLSALQVALLGPSDHPPLMVALLALEPVPLLVRRYAPTAVMAVLVAADLALALAGIPLTAVGGTIAVAAYSAGNHQERRRSLWTLGLGLAGLLALAATPGSDTGVPDQLGALLVTTVAWWLGATLRDRRRYAAELEERTRALEEARLELAEQAVAAERLRLARELHDVVAHSLAIIAVHSSVGAHNAAERPADAVAALEAINTATRSALAELRALLAVLREPGHTEAGPLPSLADLRTLVEHASRAGVTVDVDVSGDVGALPVAVSLSAYRIVQEALTNVVKHAGPVATSVQVIVHSGQIDMNVTNDPPSAKPPVDGHSGAGLAGMRERVGIFDGDLVAQPTPEGGFTVAATLRFEEAAA
jgi:signal transduction histidine kinase